MLNLIVALSLPLGTPPSPDRFQWFREARLGMFIHWGPVSLRETEIGWSRGDTVPIADYDSLYKRFNPAAFDADAWMKLAKQAGFRYVVPTAKHHDGFCLWPSEQTSYTIAATPFGRDIMGEIAHAAGKKGLAMCSYFSILDWRDPDYATGSPGGHSVTPSPKMDRFMGRIKAELSELITRYGIKLIWFDGHWEKPFTRDRSIDLNRFVRTLSPQIVINNRVESQDLGREDPRGDYLTPEQQVGSYNTEHAWETCMTLGDQWAYRSNENYKSLPQVLKILVQTVTGDGNLLLNVGPDATGRIPTEQQRLLLGMGTWLKTAGEGIYRTRGGPYHNGDWGGSTRRGHTIYIHVLDWSKGDVRLPPLPATVRSFRTLQKGVKVAVRSDEAGLVLHLVGPVPAEPTTVRLDIDRDAWTLGTIGSVR